MTKEMMSKKQRASQSERIQEKYEKMRTEYWPEVSEDELWHRKRQTGFCTVPRTLPLICRILDELSPGKPTSNTYISLWCRVYDTSIVVINAPIDLAYEAGFSGQRATSAWLARMKILKKLEFIDSREGASGEFHYVLIFNPHMVIKKIKNDGSFRSAHLTALYERALNIGAVDYAS